MGNSKLIGVLLLMVMIISGLFMSGCNFNSKNTNSNTPSSDGTAQSASSIPTHTVINGNDYVLTFNDEFDGSSLDTDKWYIEYGTGSQYNLYDWGNNEKQYYTSDNVEVADGNLVITARKESRVTKDYTSARINTKGKFSQTYGRFEARIKMPAVTGLWPAFWLLPESESDYGGWPKNGEIDIMEARGRERTKTESTLHRADGNGEDIWTNTNKNANIESIEDWHVYAVEWNKTEIKFYVDETCISTMTSDQWSTSYYQSRGFSMSAPFDKDFYIILNLAVGGQYDGNRIPPDDFEEAYMFVDYVRVYQYESENSSSTSTPNATNTPLPSIVNINGNKYVMTFSDEFDGDALDTDVWYCENGTGSNYGLTDWGNNEKQYYTSDNVEVADGNLVITAIAETVRNKNYTSARINTKESFGQTYGRFEARIKLPSGQGLWPAFWLMPVSSFYGTWAASGEIDIMEANCANVNQTTCALHYGKTWPDNEYVTNTNSVSDITDYHVYAIEWKAETIDWYIDDVKVYTVSADTWWTDGSDAASAPFDKDFYIVLNLAVGGNYLNGVKPSSDFECAEMFVDYVRVYQYYNETT